MSACTRPPACLPPMQVLSRLQHPHIVSFVGACLAPPNVCILEQLAEGGSLLSLLQAYPRGLPYAEVGGQGGALRLQQSLCSGGATCGRALGQLAEGGSLLSLLQAHPEGLPYAEVGGWGCKSLWGHPCSRVLWCSMWASLGAAAAQGCHACAPGPAWGRHGACCH